MKKTILVVLMLMCCVAVNARDLSNCQKWGYAPNDFSKLSAISYLTSPGDYGEGVKMPRNGEWTDCTIEGVSVPVQLTSMSNLRCIVATDAKFSQIIASVEVPDGTLTQGYNDIEFAEPIPVPDKDVYVGYTYHCAASAASLMVYEKGKSDGGLFLNLGGAWYDYAPYGMGVSGLQVIIGSQNLSEYDVRFRKVEWHNVLCGKSSLRAVMRSSSKHAVNSFDYVVKISGEEQKGTIVLENPVPEGMDKDFVVEIPFEAPSTPTHFDAELRVTLVDGVDNAEAESSYVAQLNCVSKDVPRNTVVEEYTGTACGYCPRGWVGMETMKERFGSRFIGVAVHQYNATDPMYNKSYARLGFIGAPSCKLDRNTEAIDPYNGSGYYPSIIGDFESVNGLLPDVAVAVSGTLSEDNQSVVVDMEAEFLGEAEDYSVGYVLTADGLTGTGAWLQDNYFNALESSAVLKDELPNLSMFCAGGEKGQSKVKMVYNDVMIASSWNEAGKSLSASLPSSILAGERIVDTFSMQLPSAGALQSALKYDELYVVAMVLDAKGRIANAARARVDATTSIKSSHVDGVNESVFTLDGRKAERLGHGVYVQDGRKVIR